MNVYTENQASYGPTWDAVNAPLICANAVSWSAVMAGAAVAAGASMMLLMLGVGLGLVATPFRLRADSTTFLPDVALILWVMVTALFASAAGGYVAGRMRMKWIAVSNNEKHFRDATHGLLAWIAAAVMSVLLLTALAPVLVGRDGAADAAASAVVSDLAAATVDTASAAQASDGRARQALLWLVIVMFGGAFVAGVAAVRGGRQRDA